VTNIKSRFRFRACSEHKTLSGTIKIARCGVRALCVFRPTSRSLASVNILKANRNTSATTQFVRLQPDCRYKTVQEAILITSITTEPSPYHNLSKHFFNHVVPAPSLRASELRLPAAGHPTAPRPSTQPTVDGRSWVAERSGSDVRASHGRAIKPLSALCNRHAKAGRSECCFPSYSNWDAVWCFALHLQWTRTEVRFKAFTTFSKSVGILQTRRSLYLSNWRMA
jgi:hypothetical protein